MSADRVGANVVGGVLTITLNRPDKRNAIDQLMIDQLQDHLERADLDQDTRVVAIRGAGKVFCAGADLSELLASADRSPEENAQSAAKLGSVFERMRDIPKPIVAVVQGRALAGAAAWPPLVTWCWPTPSRRSGIPKSSEASCPPWCSPCSGGPSVRKWSLTWSPLAAC